MTTGSSSIDTTHWDGSLSVPGSIGITSSSSWSGEDYTPAPRTLSSRVVRNPRFREGGAEPYLIDVPCWIRGPRRAKEEHSFSKSWSQSVSLPIYVENDVNGDGVMDLGWSAAPAQIAVWFNPTASSPWTSNDDVALVSKLLSQVKGSDFHLGNFLGEFNQTLGLIAETATAVYEAGKAAKKGNFQRAFAKLADHRVTRPTLRLTHYNEIWKQRALTASSNQLKLVYGVLPLLQDVQGAAEFLAHQLNVPRRQVYKASGARILKDDPYAFYNASRPPGGYYSYTPDRSELGTKKQIKLILAEADPVALSGIYDVPSTLWEITPFSFVFDWFLPIGNWLQARGMASAVTGTYVTSTKNFWMWKGAHSMNTHAIIYGAEGIGMKAGTFTRVISSSPDLPLPTFKPLVKAASWQHCLNAVSLVTQLGLRSR